MTAKRPEIELEVSCGGTFRIATEEMACRITVLGPVAAAVAAPEPVAQSPAAEPAPPPPPKADPFLGEVAARLEKDFLAATEPVADDGPQAMAAADRLLGRCGRLTALEGQLDDSFTSLAAAAGKTQAKATDLRFALTFLKNHALLSRAAREEEEGPVSVDRAELRKLLAKVEKGLEIVQALHAGLGEIKGQLAGSGGDDAGLLPLCRQMAASGQRFAETAALFSLQLEEKAAAPAVDAAESLQRARARLEKSRAAQSGGDAAPARGGDEMSDEEALAKLAEFGL
ncbi:MAG: hypothetical protein AB1568_12630 [Thermodesulfobacteriota bacterium]